MIICEPSETGRSLGALRSTSMKMGVFVEGKLCLRSVARKKADFMAEKVFLRSPAKNRGIFLARWFADKKRDTLERMSL